MTAAVEVEGLVKDYGTLRAVDGISLRIDPGEVVALLGPNGAGKSTTVEILEGYRARTDGRVQVLGIDPASGSRGLRDRIGIVLQSSGVEPELTVREALEHYGACYRRRRPLAEVIALVGLEGKADDRVRALSGGQRRRLDLALGVVGDPELLFLDEPTTGFDPAARRNAWDLVEGLRTLGTTILLTTHDMDEAQHLADRVILIDRGRVVAEGTPAALQEGLGERAVVRFRLPDTSDAVAGLLEGVAGRVTGRGAVIEIHTDTVTADLHAVTSWALERGLELPGLVVERPTLEDAYLELTAAAGTDDAEAPRR